MKTALICFLAVTMVTTGAETQTTLFDFSKIPAQYLAAHDAKFKTATDGLTVRTGYGADWPGVTLKCPDAFWDCTPCRSISAEVTNLGKEPLQLHLRVDNPGADGVKDCITEQVTLAAGETRTLSVDLYESQWIFDQPVELVGMRGFPQSSKIKPDRINQLIFFVGKPKQNHRFKISPPRAHGEPTVLKAETFLPFIDRYGQFTHADWPGKIHSDQELARQKEAEAGQLTAAAVNDRNSWGGWTKGPELKATGYFRTEKIGGQWWLADPEGKLFWSHGVDCVRTGAETPVTKREPYFSWLPRNEEAYRPFWGRNGWAPVGYYKDQGEYETFDFAGANLLRKYGTDWRKDHAELCHKRLAGWGMNTIGNWSDAEIYRLRKTPYTATLNVSARPIEGSQGYWGKFPDPFDTSFTANLRQSIERKKNESIGDPWCIGFFVDNELAWGDETSLAAAALTSPADQPAKREFIKHLKEHYGAVEKLNGAWGSSYTSWEDLAQSQKEPDKTKAAADLKAFYTVIAEKYFETIRRELKAAAPHQLYFGCRFAWANEQAVRAAAKYCDVVSFNKYEYSIADLKLPEGLDKPIIIGEFHFGALDRGMFHTGLKPTRDQDDRAQKYKDYVLGALKNPCIVGTHWFQYRDQATTGRGDGENYQIGLVDICDTPYPETIAAVRQVSEQMYPIRYANANAAP